MSMLKHQTKQNNCNTLYMYLKELLRLPLLKEIKKKHCFVSTYKTVCSPYI